MHEYPAEVLIILLNAMIQLLYFRAIKETKNAFLELTASLAGNNLDQFYPLFGSLADNPSQLPLNGPSIAKDIVQV
jgi:hypothetical protein